MLSTNTNYEIEYRFYGSDVAYVQICEFLNDTYVSHYTRIKKSGDSISVIDNLNLRPSGLSDLQFFNTLLQFCREIHGEFESPFGRSTYKVYNSSNINYYVGNYFLTSIANNFNGSTTNIYWCLFRTSSSFTFSKMDYGNKLAYIQNFPMNVQEGEFDEVCSNLLNVIATALVNCDCDLQNLYLSQTLSVSDDNSGGGSSGGSVDLTGIETKLQSISDNLKATVNIDNVETDLNVAQTIVELNNTLDEKELTVFNELDISDKLSMIPKRSGYPNDDLQF